MEPGTPSRASQALEARTRFFDAEVLAAVSAGVPQVVICGAPGGPGAGGRLMPG